MKLIPALALLLCFVVPFASITVAKDNGYSVVYDGGSLPDLKAGKKLTMYIEAGEIALWTARGSTERLPASRGRRCKVKEVQGRPLFGVKEEVRSKKI